jgi:homeodomain-containing protein
VAQKYRVILTEEQRAALHQLIASGTAPARSLTHARILLKADESEAGPAWTNRAIVEALEVDELTISRVRRRFVQQGWEAAVQRKAPERQWERKLDGAQEAHLIALACSAPPDGRDRWSMRLLAARFVELGHVEDLSHETVRQVLKRGRSSPG